MCGGGRSWDLTFICESDMRRKRQPVKPGLNPFERGNKARLDGSFPKSEHKCSDAACETLATFFDLVDDKALPVIELGLTFCGTFNDISMGIPQKVINLMLKTAFKYPEVVSKLSHVTHTFPNRGWLFWGLVSMMRHSMGEVKDSIASDAPVWSFILHHMELDLAERDEGTTYETSTRGFLVEVFPFYWDIDPNERSSVKMMVETVVSFLVEAGSRTATRILDLLFKVFPETVEDALGDNVWRLSPENIARLKHPDPSKAPQTLEMATKLLFTSEFADSEQLKQIMEMFNRDDHLFHLT